MAIPKYDLKVQRAPYITGSSPITSTQYNKQMKAVNDRLEIGFADGVWRIFYSTLAMIRNKAPASIHTQFFLTSSGYGPSDITDNLNFKSPLSQFAFGHQNSTAERSAPGSMEEESIRLTEYSSSYGNGNFQMFFGGTARDIWHQITQSQGVYDSDAIRMDSAAIMCPHRHNGYFTYLNSTYQNFGGFLPTNPYAESPNPSPGNVIGNCTDPDDGTVYPNHSMVVRNRYDNRTFTYSGTCAYEVGAYYIQVTLDTWDIYQLDVALTGVKIASYPRSDWTLGPYQNAGAYIQKGSTSFLFDSLINNYCKDFRGDYTTWTSQSYNLTNSFDYQDFLMRSYPLAPSIGVYNPGTGKMPRTNNVFTFSSLDSGSVSNNIIAPDKYALTTLFVDISGSIQGGVSFNINMLSSSVSASVITSFTSSLQSVNITTASYDGHIILIDKPWQGPSTISITLTSPVTASSFSIQANVTQYRLPDVYDLYWWLRLSGLGNVDADESNPEVNPRDNNDGPTIYANYKTYAAPISLYGTNVLDNIKLGDNLIARQFLDNQMNWTRYISPDDIVGYEMEGGSSSIYIYARDYYKPLINRDDYIDSGNKLKSDYLYYFTGSVGATGSVLYKGKRINTGDYFTASYDQDTFDQTTGSYSVILINNIKHSASKQGYSNEWLALPQLYPWGPTQERIDINGQPYNVGSWGDFYKSWPLQNKALVGVPRDMMGEVMQIGSIDVNYAEYDLLTYDRYSYPPSPLQFIYIAEMPPGYSYYSTANTRPQQCINGALDTNNLGEYASKYGGTTYHITNAAMDAMFAQYCKSNIVYKPPCKIKDINANATLTFPTYAGTITLRGLIKITFTNRMHYHEDAGTANIKMSTIDTWDCSPEDYRSDENAIRDWMIYKYWNDEDTGQYVYTRNGIPGRVRQKIGEFASQAYFSEFPNQRPLASIPMGLLLVKEIPYVYEDNNNSYDITDTRMEVDPYMMLDWYVRNMCQGYVGGYFNATNLAQAYVNNPSNPLGEFTFASAIYDYTYEALCYHATGHTQLISACSSSNIPLYYTSSSGPDSGSVTSRDIRITTQSPGITMMPNTIPYVEQFNVYSAMINSMYRARLMFPLRCRITQTSTTVITDRSRSDEIWSNVERSYFPNYCAGISYQTEHIDPAITADIYGDPATDPEGSFGGNYYTSEFTVGGSINSSIYAGFVNVDVHLPKLGGYQQQGGSYMFEPVSVYNNALPYNIVADLDSTVYIIDDIIEQWNYGQWLPDQTGCESPPWAADNQTNVCLISNGEDPPLYLHPVDPNTTYARTIQAYLAPHKGNVSLAGTAKGDEVVTYNRPTGQGNENVTNLPYTKQRSFTFLKDHIVIALTEIE